MNRRRLNTSVRAPGLAAVVFQRSLTRYAKAGVGYPVVSQAAQYNQKHTFRCAISNTLFSITGSSHRVS